MDTLETQKRSAIDQHSRQADQFAGRYEGLDSAARPTCFTYSRRRLDACLAPLLPDRGEGRRLLDVGCGTGHHLAQLRDRGYEATGVDGSAEMLEHARVLNPGADIRQADVESLPFPDESFDYVLCVEVLRYLPDPSGCIREIARVLKPGGICLVTAAPLLSLNGYWLVNRIANRVAVGNLVRLKQFFATSGRLRRSFRDAGFTKIDVQGVYSGPINWVERLTPWALPFVLRLWEPLDGAVSSLPLVREFSNMFLVHAERDRREAAQPAPGAAQSV